MKLIYLTSKKFPSAKADPFYVKSMAGAFNELLGQDFLFLVRGNVPDELKRINTMSAPLPRRFRVVLYFFYMPILFILHGWSKKEIVFLSYDPYLLSILIFWRQAFGFKYSVCSDWHQLFGDWRDKYVAKHSDYLTTTSQRLKRLLTSVCGVDQDKIMVAYGGVDKNLFNNKSKTNKLEYRRMLGLPKDMFLVGYIGAFKSIGQEKGISTMIKALPPLSDNIKMAFIGGSAQQISEYTALLEELGVKERCIFVGWQTPEKAIEYEMAMDILVIPYPDKPHFRDYGFPMKVWEYMASGRPIIYSNLEIMREVLGGRATSFQPDDASSFANAVLSIYQDAESAEEIARKNTNDVQAYTWKARAENILNFIQT